MSKELIEVFQKFLEIYIPKAYLSSMEKFKNGGNSVKVFLENGIMLSGRVVDYDRSNVVLDSGVVINRIKIISIAPEEK